MKSQQHVRKNSLHSRKKHFGMNKVILCLLYTSHKIHLLLKFLEKGEIFVNLFRNSNQLATNFKYLKNSQRYFWSFSSFCCNLSRRICFFVTLADYQSTLIQHIRRLQIAIYSFSFKQNKPRFILTLYA